MLHKQPMTKFGQNASLPKPVPRILYTWLLSYIYKKLIQYMKHFLNIQVLS